VNDFEDMLLRRQDRIIELLEVFVGSLTQGQIIPEPHYPLMGDPPMGSAPEESLGDIVYAGWPFVEPAPIIDVNEEGEKENA
jgi:hypothetical protein